eukprot:jgi/Mesvir1/21515/Mv03958-RA.1
MVSTKALAWAFASLFLVFACTGPVLGTETEEAADETEVGTADEATDLAIAEPHPLENLPPPSEDIQTIAVFPNNPEKTLPSGKVTEVLVGVYNGGSTTMNLTRIMGSLNMGWDFSYYVQNFTEVDYSVVLEPGAQASLSYPVQPHAKLPPRMFQLALTVCYKEIEEEGVYTMSTTFFNSTVEVTEAPSLVDVEMFSLYAVGGALLLLALFAGYRQLSKMGTKKKSRARATPYVETGTKADHLNNEWLQGTNFMSHEKKKSSKSKKKAA